MSHLTDGAGKAPLAAAVTDAAAELRERCRHGWRFAALAGDSDLDGRTTLRATVVQGDRIERVDVAVPRTDNSYPSLTPDIPAAFWYERMVHDTFGVVPTGHPRLDPLVLPQRPDRAEFPRLGHLPHPDRLGPDERALASHVTGSGLFTIPHGPVRSGVFESVEYVVETPGEDISHVNVRPFAKHRGVEARFEGQTVRQGVLLAERVEGIASVAHALAYAHAIERLAEQRPPARAQLIRVIHAELERLANHLDVALKLADAAGLAVAVARFGWHKERTLRIVSSLCGNRFGRGVVIPGGVRAEPLTASSAVCSAMAQLERDVAADAELLMNTPSFLDRLRGTGVITPEHAASHGLLGPVGRGSGCVDDCRWVRPYDAYPLLSERLALGTADGDALARLRVRWAEIVGSFELIRESLELLAKTRVDIPLPPLATPTGIAIGWAEAPQGEVLYLVRTDADGRIARCAPRSASFHNLAIFSHTFRGDVLTDFPFIEASFGVSIAGVAL